MERNYYHAHQFGKDLERMATKQLFLKLVQPVAPNSVNAIRVQYESIYFDFPGHINKIDKRKGQFQYRYGVKVQPPDEKLNKKKGR